MKTEMCGHSHGSQFRKNQDDQNKGTGAIYINAFITMAVMENMYHNFGESIRWVEGGVNLMDDNLALLNPILNSL